MCISPQVGSQKRKSGVKMKVIDQFFKKIPAYVWILVAATQMVTIVDRALAIKNLNAAVARIDDQLPVDNRQFYAESIARSEDSLRRKHLELFAATTLALLF